MRVVLGCGEQYTPTWWNVDIPSCPHPADERVDLAGPLPWPEHSIGLAYAGHILEHMEPDQCAHLLTALLPLMRPGGEILVVGPDVNRAIEMAAGGHVLEVPYEDIRDGSRRWPGDEHRWAPDAVSTSEMLEQAGWTGIRTIDVLHADAKWPIVVRILTWQYAVTATAPGEKT